MRKIEIKKSKFIITKIIALALAVAVLCPSIIPGADNISTAVAASYKMTKKSSSTTLSKGHKLTLKLSPKKVKVNTKKIKWTSSNKKIATVTSKGVVKGINTGKVTITAKYKKVSYKCKITVVKNEFLNKEYRPKYDDYSDGVHLLPKSIYYSKGRLGVKTVIYNHTSEKVEFTDGVVISVYTKPVTDPSKSLIGEQTFAKKESNSGFGFGSLTTDEEDEDKIEIGAYDYEIVTYVIPKNKVRKSNCDLRKLTAENVRYITYQ